MPPVQYRGGGFPPELDWASLVPYIGLASAAIARYDGILAAIPNPALLLSPLTTQEAVLSSRIEGTQATMVEVLEFEAGRAPATPERRDDIQEILNYRQAMHAAADALATLPLSARVIRQAHAVLLEGVRGHSKAPGEFRRTPVWIGPPGSDMEHASFVPIGADKLPEAFGRWEQYLHEDQPDRLVQLAVLHAEFEALHPFLDGNGRLGRMIIPLFLWQVGMIRQPMFYISGFLDEHCDEYYEGLARVSREGDWSGWCRFFLQAVKAQAEDNLAKATAILELHRETRRNVVRITKSPFAGDAVDWLFGRPIFAGSDFHPSPESTARTARRLLDTLLEAGLLVVLEVASGRRPAVIAFPALVNAAEGRQVL